MEAACNQHGALLIIFTVGLPLLSSEHGGDVTRRRGFSFAGHVGPMNRLETPSCQGTTCNSEAHDYTACQRLHRVGSPVIGSAKGKTQGLSAGHSSITSSAGPTLDKTAASRLLF